MNHFPTKVLSTFAVGCFALGSGLPGQAGDNIKLLRLFDRSENEIYLNITELKSEACLLSSDGIKEVAEATLQKAGLKVSDVWQAWHLTVMVNSREIVPEFCAATVDLTLSLLGIYLHYEADFGEIMDVNVIRSGSLSAISEAQSQTQLHQLVSEQIEGLSTAILKGGGEERVILENARGIAHPKLRVLEYP